MEEGQPLTGGGEAEVVHHAGADDAGVVGDGVVVVALVITRHRVGLFEAPSAIAAGVAGAAVAEEHHVLIGEAVVEADGADALIRRRGDEGDVIVGESERIRGDRVGHGVEGHDASRQRINPVRGNDVAGERIADVARPVGVRTSGGGVVEGDQPPLPVAQIAEVAGAEIGMGYGTEAGGTRGAPQPLFITGEEEGTVAAVVELGQVNGSAHGTAELVVAQHLLDAARARVGLGGEGVTRIEGVVAQELVSGSVNLVAAHLGHHVDDTAGSLAELSLEGAGFHAELLHRIGHRHHRDLVVYRRGIHAAVQEELVPISRTAVDAHLGEVLVADFGEPVGVIEAGLDASHDLHQVEHVASVQGEFFDALALDSGAEHGVLGADAGDLCGDGHTFGDVADVHLDVDAEALSDFEVDAGLQGGFEAREGSLERVEPDGELRDDIGAVGIALAAVGEIGGDVGGGDSDAGHACALWIGNGAGEGGEGGLRCQGQR
jgi:hypothetical protein